MTRLGIAFFFDEDGIVDEYYIFLLKELRKFTDKIIFVSNGKLVSSSEWAVQAIVDEVLLRDNVGFDVAAYSAALNFLGFEQVSLYDEVIFFNHTFYGPLFPFEEMFSVMEKRSCDFWGISAHKEIRPNPFNGESVLPFHLNSHFIAVRSTITRTDAFRDYWGAMPEIDSYTASILLHEARFTHHFQSLGYEVDSYLDPNTFGTNYGLFEEVDHALAQRSPILKRRSFFIDPILADKLALDLARALSVVERHSNYDTRLMWANLLRKHELRVLHTNTALMSILDDREPEEEGAWRRQKIAVCIHIYYVEMVEELLEYCLNVPIPFDLIVTTDSESKKAIILAKISDNRGEFFRSMTVLVVLKNVGADTSALLITCRDYLYGRGYDVICRLHSKKSPQDSRAQARFFKRHLFENLINSRGYVANVLKLFADNPRVGIAFPPAIHVHYGTLGHGWFTNKEKSLEIAGRLKLRVPFDDATPLAPYGGMFWFRPTALSKLFAFPWTWDEFEMDGVYTDGDLPHAIERLYAYVAQDAGFLPRTIASIPQAEQNYVRLEYKVQRLASLTPKGDLNDKCEALQKWRSVGFPMPAEDRDPRVAIYSNAEPLPLPVRLGIQKEYLRSHNRFWGNIFKRFTRVRQSLTLRYHIDSINGLPNPAGSVLKFSRYATESLVIRGWLVGRWGDATFSAVILRLEGGGGRIAESCALHERPDVAEHLGNAGLLRCGFEAKIDTRQLPKGTFSIRLVGITERGKRRISEAASTIVIS